MKTKQKISFVSWNTTNFLDYQLNQLLKERLIYFYIYIFHLPEDDEDKEHHHVIIYPAKPLDYDDIKVRLTEPVKNGLKPLGISFIPFIESKDGDLHWILYNLHDPVYCKIKCKEEKKYTYPVENLISPDEDTLKHKVHEAYTTTDFYKDSKINDMIKAGISPAELIDNGYIPIKEACSYHHYFQMKKEG